MIIQHQQNSLPLDVLKTDIDSIGCAIGRTIDDSILTAAKNTLFKFVAKLAYPVILFRQVCNRQFTGATQSDDSGDIFGTRTLTPLLMSTLDIGSDAGAFTDVKCTNPFRGMKLVPGDC